MRKTKPAACQESGEASRRTRRAVALWLRLARFVNSQHPAMSEQLRTHGLSLAQFDVIAQVGSAEGLTQRDLAGKLVVTEGNITQLLDKMEERGLVSRDAEGRCNRLWLTKAGRRLYAEAVPMQNEHVAGLMSVLTEDEQGELSRMLRKLQRRSG